MYQTCVNSVIKSQEEDELYIILSNCFIFLTLILYCYIKHSYYLKPCTPIRNTLGMVVCKTEKHFIVVNFLKFSLPGNFEPRE